MEMFFKLDTTLTPEQVYKLLNLNPRQFRLGSNLILKIIMSKIVTFCKEVNGYIDFTVDPAYYGTAALQHEALYYVPNPVVGEDAPLRTWIVPHGREKDIQFDDDKHAECRVDVYPKEAVNAGCPPGWSVVVIDPKQYGERMYVEVKEVLYTHLFEMKEGADPRKLRVYDRTTIDTMESGEVARISETRQELSTEEAFLLSLYSDGCVHAGVHEFGKFPTFFKGEITSYTDHVLSNDFLVEDEEQTQERINAVNAGAVQAMNEVFLQLLYSDWSMGDRVLGERVS